MSISARAQEYALLAMLLAQAPDAETLGRIAQLPGNATPLGRAHLALAQAADTANPETVEREFFNLFIGVGRGELLPYGSYYLTGFLNERPLARLRQDLRAQGIERAEGLQEPEDHAAILCEIMAGLAGGQLQRRQRFRCRSSKRISHPGSRASLPIWNGLTRRISTAMWERSAGSSWRLRLRPSRCPRERAANERRTR